MSGDGLSPNVTLCNAFVVGSLVWSRFLDIKWCTWVSSSRSNIWRNILGISSVNATFFSRKRNSTPSKLQISPGPLYRKEFNDAPWYGRAGSKTTRSGVRVLSGRILRGVGKKIRVSFPVSDLVHSQKSPSCWLHIAKLCVHLSFSFISTLAFFQ